MIPQRSTRTCWLLCRLLPQRLTTRVVLLVLFAMVFPFVTFVSRVLPAQEDILKENLERQTRSLAASLTETTISSIIAEDYSQAIEQCQKVLAESPELRFLVITRSEDGFSLVVTRDGWSQETRGEPWRSPPPAGAGHLMTLPPENGQPPMFGYAFPVVYLNWNWGWIHIGLSQERFRSDLASVYWKLGRLALLCLAIGLAVSLVLARFMVLPLARLSAGIQRIAAGDLSIRVRAGGSEEVAAVGEAVNDMAARLQQTLGDLRSSRDYADNIIRSLIGLLVVLDSDGRIRFANAAALALLGYEEGELLGRPFGDILVETKIDAAESGRVGTLEMLLARGSIAGVERGLRRKDGQVLPALFSASVMRRDDEVAGLVCAAIDLTEHKRAALELETLHKQLVDASRAAGMAEVAGNVLHNVGNVLNSVNVTSTMLQERVARSKIPALARLTEMLATHRGDLAAFLTTDERGRNVLPYIEELARHLADERAALQTELGLLSGKIDHIKEVVAMQQSYSKIFGLRETVPLRQLVEDALRMNFAALERHGITLERDFQPVPDVTIDRHKVLQILVNLVRNAKYAMDEQGPEVKRLRVTIAPVPDADRIAIAISDNGVGISPEVREHLFEHGFTTRKTGHGFGLHSSILAARELGGTLRADSSGVGCGATFVLEIPLDEGAPAHD